MMEIVQKDEAMFSCYHSNSIIVDLLMDVVELSPLYDVTDTFERFSYTYTYRAI